MKSFVHRLLGLPYYCIYVFLRINSTKFPFNYGIVIFILIKQNWSW